jgi:dihydroxyacetone kinase-like predicted kinase
VATSFQFHGDNLAVALQSGIHRVIGEQDFLNRINVFPVADGEVDFNFNRIIHLRINKYRSK